MKGKKLVILGEHHLCDECVNAEISKIKEIEDKIDLVGLEIVDVKKKNTKLCSKFNQIPLEKFIEDVVENNFPLCSKSEMYETLKKHEPLLKYLQTSNKKIYPLGNPFARNHAASLVKSIDSCLDTCQRGTIAIIGFGDIIEYYTQFVKKYRCTINNVHQIHQISHEKLYY
ncbi:MAG: hypothetical protein OH319_03880 [Candidatus Parvarchaeota archaeon]|nr:hypothetical protein [Candidatus Jingweiarchaeum tengchongense]MCW1298075.1 hypothetical protein [Candidatus Jingweiarchaeum tengchongense]MCW1300125.1 hypothetical protein [Candidatus Jingweiarchaeum tengchongense]MCW1309625.1 hypothetical protein [Candidatus Jingweiarchaeum tengchongense]MCW1310887.1 hypothetical protein [Candidatus Jingweiarchaeum tengchongense]